MRLAVCSMSVDRFGRKIRQFPGRLIVLAMAITLVATLADQVTFQRQAAADGVLARGAEQQESAPLERPDAAAALVTARLTGQPVRISGMTSETAEYVALPNGQIQATIHSGIMRVRQGDGWVPVDVTLRRQTDGSVAPVAHPFDLTLSGSRPAGSGELLAIGRGGDRLSVGWPGPLPEPVLAGNRATYLEVLPGVDLVVEAGRENVETFFVVKSRAAAARVADLRLPVSGPNVGSVSEDGAGNLAVKDTNNRVFATVPAPLMWDARKGPAGDPAVRVPVASSRVARSARAGRHGGFELRLQPDATWLADAARQYPVTIDPQINPLYTTFDTYVRQDLTSDRSGTNDLQLGITTGSNPSVARAFVHWGVSALRGTQITSATVYFWNWYSTTCSAKSWEIWSTGPASSSTRWNNQPAWNYKEATSTATKGYNTSCNDGWVSISGTSFFQRAANNNQTTAYMGIRATNESDGLAWKQFRSRNAADPSQVPYAVVNYNAKPQVTARQTVPSTTCTTGSGRPYINTKTPQLKAQITDAEKSQIIAKFEWWVTNGSVIGSTTLGPAASGSWLTAAVPSGAFAENGTYSWRVQGYDGSVWGPWSTWCEFTVDTISPSAAPSVSSSNYPQGQWAGGAGIAANFTFGASGVSDVQRYEYGLDVNPPEESVNASSLGGGASVSVPVTNDGPHTLYVRSVDRSGNRSPTYAYHFNAGSAGITAPKTGDITAAKTAITSVASPGITAVTYQWRRGDADAWVTIPASDVTKANGGAAVTWPLSGSGGVFEKLNWDVAKTLNDVEPGPEPLDGPVQVRGVFNGGAASSPVTITFDKNNASGATTTVGPCTVNLITGNCLLSETDVSVDSYGTDLTVTRSFNTRRATQTDSANMFGPGWVSGVVVEEAEAPFTHLYRVGSLVQVGLPDGDTIGFAKKGAITGGESFTPEIGMEMLTLKYLSGSDSYTLTDPGGTVTTFTRVAGSPAGMYNPTAVTVPGSAQTTTISWESATVGGATVVRPTRMLAPVPDGVNCTTLTRGCRALTFTYATATTATGTAEAQWGDYAGRLVEVSFTAWDPDLPTPAMRTVAVVRYAYDNTGRLRAMWDPRLDWTDEGGVHHLWERYTYHADGTMAAITPVGEPPWQLSYTTVPADLGTGRLAAVSRSALSAGTATTTVVYRVPVFGPGAPYDLSGAQTARWHQTEPPTDATAVFPPTQVPDGNQAAGTMPSSFERATVSYLDANARLVNTAQPGGHIDTTWYDQWGNVIRTLTAANRKRALELSPSDTPAEEAAAARAFSTLNTYSSDGRRMTSIMGPEHEVMLDDGSIIRARTRTEYTYDEGAPGGGPYDLVTTEVTKYYWYPTGYFGGATVSDANMRVTKTEYDWTLRQPTKVIKNYGGLNLTTRTQYDPITGLVVATTSPAGGASDNTPATRKTIYYRATAGSGYAECDLKPEWANLPCRVQPGGQPATGPEVPTTVTTYDMFNQPRTMVEKTSAGVLRTTTTTYDSAARPHETTVTATAGLGTPLPKQRRVYDIATDRLLRIQSINTAGTVTAEIVNEYDDLGRLISYTDADGNTSTFGYDIASRPVTVFDGKATRTLSYDGGVERRGLVTAVTDTQAGSFTDAVYDADGKLVSYTWPNGVVVATSYDETGTAVGISYTKPGCGQPDCTLFSESLVASIHDQVRQRVSSLSEQTFGYDGAGRLTTVADIRYGDCTTRVYGYDTASNRTSLTSFGPDEDGACQTTTVAASRTWSYDSADRITTAGTGYDALGRTTTVPAADTANPAGGDVSIGYHHSDLVRSISQGERSTEYTLDVTGERVRSWTDTVGEESVTHTHHYSGDGDSPAWTQEGPTGYSRIVAGLGGMAAIYHSETATLSWQIVNLHGDVVASIDGAEPGLTDTSEATEYGAMREPVHTGYLRYGWLGSRQRAADTPTGIVLMGVRLYNPATGRFLQVDPVPGGSCNAYDYACADPINVEDLDGKAIPAIIGGIVLAARGIYAGCRAAKKWCVRAGKWLWNRAIKPAARWTWKRVIVPAARWSAQQVRKGIDVLRKTSVTCRRFPNVGGFGCDLRYNGHRKFGVHFHRVGKWYLPHYHRRPGIGRHRPWDGGW